MENVEINQKIICKMYFFGTQNSHNLRFLGTKETNSHPKQRGDIHWNQYEKSMFQLANSLSSLVI